MGILQGAATTWRQELGHWHDAGKHTLGDLYSDEALLLLEELTADIGLPPGQFLLHNSIIRSLTAHWGNMQQESDMHVTIQYIYVLGDGCPFVHWLASYLRSHTATSLVALIETPTWIDHTPTGSSSAL